MSAVNEKRAFHACFFAFALLINVVMLGLVISGIQYVTARDDASKTAKVKSRVFNIVIGLLAYGLMWVALQWLMPGGIL